MSTHMRFGYAFAVGLVVFGLWMLLSGSVESPTLPLP